MAKPKNAGAVGVDEETAKIVWERMVAARPDIGDTDKDSADE